MAPKVCSSILALALFATPVQALTYSEISDGDLTFLTLLPLDLGVNTITGTEVFDPAAGFAESDPFRFVIAPGEMATEIRFTATGFSSPSDITQFARRSEVRQASTLISASNEIDLKLIYLVAPVELHAVPPLPLAAGTYQHVFVGPTFLASTPLSGMAPASLDYEIQITVASAPPVPLPASVLFLLGGVAGLVGLRRVTR